MPAVTAGDVGSVVTTQDEIQPYMSLYNGCNTSTYSREVYLYVYDAPPIPTAANRTALYRVPYVYLTPHDAARVVYCRAYSRAPINSYVYFTNANRPAGLTHLNHPESLYEHRP